MDLRQSRRLELRTARSGLASYAGVSLVEHLQSIEPFSFFLLLGDVLADLFLVSTYRGILSAVKHICEEVADAENPRPLGSP